MNPVTAKNQITTRLGIGLMTAALSLTLSPMVASAATLSQQLFLSGEIEENSVIFTADTLDFDGVIAEIFTTPTSDSSTLEDLLIIVNTIDNPTAPEASLDWDEIADSLSQLRFEAVQWGTEVEPETLPQVADGNIMQGIYEFEFPVAATSDINSFTFDLPLWATLPNEVSLPTASVLNNPFTGLNAPSTAAIGRIGRIAVQLPSYGGVGAFTPVGLSRPAVNRGGNGLNLERQSIRAQFMRVWSDNIDARWDLYPDKVGRTMPTTVQGNLSSEINRLEQSFNTKVNVSFQLLPQNRFPTALDLTDDYVKTSPILNRDIAASRLQVTQDIRNYLRNSAQQETQRLVDLQQRQQGRFYDRNQALQQQR